MVLSRSDRLKRYRISHGVSGKQTWLRAVWLLQVLAKTALIWVLAFGSKGGHRIGLAFLSTLYYCAIQTLLEGDNH